MKHFSIKDLEDFSGIKKHTIRVWENRYNFLNPGRTDTLIRRYSSDEINILLDAALLNQQGIKVSHIASMGQEEKKTLLSATEHRKIKAVHDLIISMAEMDVNRFEIVLDSCILYFGIHQTIKDVIYPFAQRTGMLEKWEDKSYIENIVLVKESLKRKLYIGIEKASPFKEIDKTFLLFLSPGEKQESSLLFLHYFLKEKGYTVLYLGNQITTDCLIKLLHFKKPDFCITSQFEKTRRFSFVDTNNHLPKLFPKMNFYSIGSINDVDMEVINYKTVRNVEDVMKDLL